ncbi:hypothetical protein Droror1_Dr00026970 [Drosera rotundifolia]
MLQRPRQTNLSGEKHLAAIRRHPPPSFTMNSLTTVCAAAVSSIPTTTLHGGAGPKISISITPTKSLSYRSLSFTFAAPNKKNNSSLPISTRLAAAGKERSSREAWEERELIEESGEDVGADDDVILDDEEEFKEGG